MDDSRKKHAESDDTASKHSRAYTWHMIETEGVDREESDAVKPSLYDQPCRHRRVRTTRRAHGTNTYTTPTEWRKNPAILRFHACGGAPSAARSNVGNGSDSVWACVGRTLGRTSVSSDVPRLGGGDAGSLAYSSGRYQNGERNDGGAGVGCAGGCGVWGAGVRPDATVGVSGIMGSVLGFWRRSRVPSSAAAFGLLLRVWGDGATGVCVCVCVCAMALSSTGTASLRKSADRRDLFTTIPAVVRRMWPLRRSGSVWNLRSSGWVAGGAASVAGQGQQGLSTAVVTEVRREGKPNVLDLSASDEAGDETDRAAGVRSRGRDTLCGTVA